MSVKGKASWSGPHNWAYLDMVRPTVRLRNVVWTPPNRLRGPQMMTGGQGCTGQCKGGRPESGVCNFTSPQHCPGQNDNEYRTEASLYAVVSSPMMVGTDIRLMTVPTPSPALDRAALFGRG